MRIRNFNYCFKTIIFSKFDLKKGIYFFIQTLLQIMQIFFQKKPTLNN